VFRWRNASSGAVVLSIGRKKLNVRSTTATDRVNMFHAFTGVAIPLSCWKYHSFSVGGHDAQGDGYIERVALDQR